MTWTILYLIFGREWWPHKATQSKIPDGEKYKEPFFCRRINLMFCVNILLPLPVSYFATCRFQPRKHCTSVKGRGKIGGPEDLVVLGMFCIFISNRWGIQHGWGLRSVWAAEHRGTKQFSPQWPTAHCNALCTRTSASCCYVNHICHRFVTHGY